jgi:hypothetical protein
MNRVLAVRSLVSASRPVAESIAALATYPWDCEEELVQLRQADVGHVLLQYQRGAMSAAEVEAWANAIEGRDDVGMADKVAAELLHELANPLLSQPISPGLADSMLKRLSQ